MCERELTLIVTSGMQRGSLSSPGCTPRGSLMPFALSSNVFPLEHHYASGHVTRSVGQKIHAKVTDQGHVTARLPSASAFHPNFEPARTGGGEAKRSATLS